VLLDLRKKKGSPVIKAVEILSHKYLLLLAIDRGKTEVDEDKGDGDNRIPF
jgi:hypothetical protein